MTAVRALALAAAAALCVPRVATAQPAGGHTRGEQLFDEAAQHLDRGEYDQAIAKFTDALPLYPEPLILFNIATAHRKQGTCDEARAYYQRYLATGPAADYRRKAEDRLAEMEACVAAKTAAPAPPDPRTAPDPGSAKAPQPGDTPSPSIIGPRLDDRIDVDVGPTRRGRGKRVGGLITIGAGVVLAGAGGYFSTRARAAARDVEDACADGCIADDVAGRDADGKAAQRNATIFYAAGGVAIAAGAALAVWGWRDGREAPRHLALVPSRSGALAVAAWSF